MCRPAVVTHQRVVDKIHHGHTTSDAKHLLGGIRMEVRNEAVQDQTKGLAWETTDAAHCLYWHDLHSCTADPMQELHHNISPLAHAVGEGQLRESGRCMVTHASR